jgi:hypothetical protein
MNFKKNKLVIISIVLCIILVVLFIIYKIKNNNENFYVQTPDPFIRQDVIKLHSFESLSKVLFPDLYNNVELFKALKSDLLKLDELRYPSSVNSEFLVKNFKNIFNNPLTLSTNQNILSNIRSFIEVWASNEIFFRYSIELPLLMVCATYEENKLIPGDKHLRLLEKKLDAFIYFIKNYTIYWYYLKFVKVDPADTTVIPKLNLDSTNLIKQIRLIRQEKLRLYGASNINEYYNIIKNSDINYQTSGELLTEKCSNNSCGKLDFGTIISTFIDQIITYNIFSENIEERNRPTVFGDLEIAPEKIIKTSTDYFGNPVNIPSEIPDAIVPFPVSPQSYSINTSIESFGINLSAPSALSLLKSSGLNVLDISGPSPSPYPFSPILSPSDKPSNTDPVNTVPANTVPANTVPANTDPANTVPANTVPSNTVPANTVPSNTVPANTVPANTVPANTFPANTVPANTTIPSNNLMNISFDTQSPSMYYNYPLNGTNIDLKNNSGDSNYFSPHIRIK